MNSKTKWIIWALLLVFYMIMGGVVMSGHSKRIAETSTIPDCALIPDLLIFKVTRDNVEKSLDCMGEEGRQAYYQAETRGDSIYPLAYSLFLAFTLWSLSFYLFKKPKLSLFLALLPIAAMMFDYLENMQFLKMLRDYPEILDGTISKASLFANLKWAFALSAMALVILAAIASLGKLITGRNRIN